MLIGTLGGVAKLMYLANIEVIFFERIEVNKPACFLLLINTIEKENYIEGCFTNLKLHFWRDLLQIGYLDYSLHLMPSSEYLQKDH